MEPGNEERVPASGSKAAVRRIMLVESGVGLGGSAFSLFRIVKGLDASEFQPHVVVYHRAPVFDQIRARGVPLTTLSLRTPFGSRQAAGTGLFGRIGSYLSVYGNLLTDALINGIRIARYIRRNDIDLVHCNNGFFENFAAACAARITGTPCVSHVRGTEPLMKIERILHRWIDTFIVLNQEMFDAYALAFGEDGVRLVPNGVDLAEFEEADPGVIRAEFGIDDDAFCIGTFARLVEGKGVPEFLTAASSLGDEHENLQFFVVGGGSDDSEFEAELHEMARRLGLGDRVIFTGGRNDIRDFMAAMDLVMQISTTYPEGMSLAPIEAMALSRPVIVTDIAGYANIVVDGQTGFIVPGDDVDLLAERIAMLAADRELAQQFGARGRQRIVAQFDYRIVADRVQAVYRQRLGDPARTVHSPG